MRLSQCLSSRAFLLSCWLPAQFVVCAVCLILSARAYPHYSIIDHDISCLGEPRLNPAGWQFWSAAVGLSGVMLWPVTGYISRAVRCLTVGPSAGRRRLAAAAAIAARSSCLGSVGLAVIPYFPSLEPAHEMAGTFAMGGLYAGLWIFAGILAVSPPKSLAKTLILILALGSGPVGYLLTQGWRYFVYGEVGHDVHMSPQSLLLEFSLWEWLLYFCLFPALLLVVFWSPDTQGEPNAGHADPGVENTETGAEAAI